MTNLLPVQSFAVGDTEDPPYIQRPQKPDVVLRDSSGETHTVPREYENIIIIFLSAGFRIVEAETEGGQK